MSSNEGGNQKQEKMQTSGSKRVLPASIADEQGPLTKDGEMPQKKFYRSRAHWCVNIQVFALND